MSLATPCVITQDGMAEDEVCRNALRSLHLAVPVGLSILCIIQGSVHPIQVSIPAVLYASLRSLETFLPHPLKELASVLTATKPRVDPAFLVIFSVTMDRLLSDAEANTSRDQRTNK